MPYTDEDTQRKPFDHAIALLQEEVQSFDIEDREGILNYIVSRVIVGSFLDVEAHYRYKYMFRCGKTLEAASDEFRRRVLDKYEELCIAKNGDIKEYEDFDAWIEEQWKDLKPHAKWKGPRRG